MYTCPVCNAAIREGARFCPSCGTEMSWPQQATAAQPSLPSLPAPPSFTPAPGPYAAPIADPYAAPPAQFTPASPAHPPPQPSYASQPQPQEAPAPLPIPPSALEHALARTKSYIGPAVLVFLLYYLLYLPGLIVNQMYLAEAREMEQLAGRSLPGTGCLKILLWLGLIPLILTVILFFAFLGGSLGRLF